MDFSRFTHPLILICFLIINLNQSLSVIRKMKVDSNDIESMLQKSKKLKADEFVVWRVQNQRPVYLEINEYNNVSEDPHIILERLRNNEKEWNLCYWLPRLAEQQRQNHHILDINYYAAAAYTMALDQLLNENSYHHYSRAAKYETAGHVIGMFDTCLHGGVMRKFNLKTKGKYFILLEEENYVHIKQDFPMNHILQADYCAVLYSTNVFVFCGNMNIYNRLRNMTHTLGNLVKDEVQKYDPDVRYIEIEYRRSIVGLSEQEKDDVVTFYRAINFSHVTPYNVPDLGNRTETQKNQIISRTWKAQALITMPAVGTRDMSWLTWYDKGPLQKSVLKADKCFVVVSHGKYQLNIFLWFGKETTIEDRISASAKVELVVWTFSVGIENHLFTGIVHIMEDGKESLEFKANFIDWFDEENLVYGQRLQHSMAE